MNKTETVICRSAAKRGLLTVMVILTAGFIEATAATPPQKDGKLHNDHYTSAPSDNPLLLAMGYPKRNGGFERDGFHLWDPSIIKVGDTYHMFASCWPDEDFSKWKQSYIVRAVSKNLLGPYQYVEDVIRPQPKSRFDSQGCHNPKITFHDGKFYLYYLGIPAWKGGVAVSDAVEGPWKRPTKAVIPLNNPAVWIHEDGSVYAVGKVKLPNPKYPGSRKFDELFHYLQAAKADSILGPYTRLHKGRENALPENFEIEDPCVWYDGSKYHILVTDLHGYATGHNKAFTYYTSQDGLRYELVSKDPLFSSKEPIRFDDGSATNFQRVERPNVVLNEKGQVIAVLAACLPSQTGSPKKGSRILVFPVDNYSAKEGLAEKTKKPAEQSPAGDSLKAAPEE